MEAGGSAWQPIDVSSWSNIKAVAAGADHVIGLKEDGTVVATGSGGWGQINVSGWSNIKQPDCLSAIEISPPASLTAADTSCDSGGSITLSWGLSPDDPVEASSGSIVSGYNIYRSDTAGGPYALIGNVNSGVGSYNDNTAVTGATYYYIVRTTDVVNESTDSNEASAASARNLPLAPTNLTATDTPYDLGGSITLSWTKSTDDGTGLNNVTSYKIYRYSAANGNIATLASVQAGTTGYVDNATVDIDTYYYSIRAYDSQCSSESEASNIATGQSANNFTALSGYIEALSGISAELYNSLTSKVESAIASFDGGSIEAAENKLNALLNEISAQSGKKIDTDTAALLTLYVQNVISRIQ